MEQMKLETNMTKKTNNGKKKQQPKNQNKQKPKLR